MKMTFLLHTTAHDVNTLAHPLLQERRNTKKNVNNSVKYQWMLFILAEIQSIMYKYIPRYIHIYKKNILKTSK